MDGSSESVYKFKEKDELSSGDHQSGEGGDHYPRSSPMNPVKLKRRVNCQMHIFCYFTPFVAVGLDSNCSCFSDHAT